MVLSVIDSFLEQARSNPERDAITHHASTITYADLANRVQQLSNYIKKQGVGTNSHVVICLNRSIDLITSLLAVMHAGGTYIPVDPLQPSNRIALIFEDVKPDLVLTESGIMQVHQFDNKSVVLDKAQWFDKQAIMEIKSPSKLADLAYIIFTSGSTGRPKGVKIPHSALSVFLETMTNKPGLKRQDSLLSVTTISFDIAALELYLPLINGARVVLIDSKEALNGQYLQSIIVKENITIFQATPATYYLLIDSGWQGSDKIKLLCGGEAMSTELSKQLLERSAELWNMYGPTETTIWSTVKHIQSSDEKVLIGKAIQGTQVYVLDEQLQEVTNGEVGELCIAGKGLAHGYYNRDDLTNDRFVEVAIDGEYKRIYRTGDLARTTDNGDIECLGRMDKQVKIRGYRIELGEIEAALIKHPQIKSVVVNVHESNHRKSLIAYVIPTDGIEFTIIEVKEFLADKIPDYMQPSGLMHMTEFPLTPNNKVDSKSLPEYTFTASKTGIERPANDIEQQIVDNWKKILSLPSIDISTNFIESGGDSLNYIRATMELENIIGEPPDGWEKLTIKELAICNDSEPLSSRYIRWMDTEIVLRAIAIFMVVLNGLGITPYWGDSDILFLVAGFTFATYQFKSTIQSSSIRPIMNTLGRVMLPTFVFVIISQILFGNFSFKTLFFIGNFWVPGYVNGIGQYWFIFVYIQLLAIMLVLFSVKYVRELATANAFRFTAFAFLLAVFLKELVHFTWDTNHLFQRVPQHFITIFVVGWLIGLSNNKNQKVIAIVALMIAAYGMGGFEKIRIYTIFASGLLLISIFKLPTPLILNRMLYYISGGSLFIYLTYTTTNSFINRFITNEYVWFNVFTALVVGAITWYIWDKVVVLTAKLQQEKAVTRNR